ncbi:MAG: proton-conducting transporter membrane subunit [Phycisphaerae bacterium]
MLLIALILVPLLASVLALLVGSNSFRPWIAAGAGVAHFVLTITILAIGVSSIFDGWIGLDPPGKLTLLLISLLFLLCSFYSIGYLRLRSELSNRILVACLLAFLAGATLVTCSQQLGLMWIAVEATALSTAPMIYFNRTRLSIEATWKYLLISSVGIAIALMGSFFMAYAALQQNAQPSLVFSQLVLHAAGFNILWLKMAFVLLLVGYGTKMGLAPMHTWKPDAYGEAPGVVGALLAGGLTSCAFLAVLRIDRVCQAAGIGGYTGGVLIGIGLFSMAVAAVFMLGQKDIKRMLAYSSVEQMGILALGAGIGGPALYGALLQMINNGLTKGMLFLSAGNIHRSFGSKSTDEVHGAMHRLPLSGTIFMLGFLAITGSPPFGPFVSEFTILHGSIHAGRFLVAGLFLVMLLIVFIGMGRTVLSISQGQIPSGRSTLAWRGMVFTRWPLIVLLLLVLMLGVHIPYHLSRMLQQATVFMGVR